MAVVLGIVLAPLNASLPWLANRMVDDYIVVGDFSGLKKMGLLFLIILLVLSILKYSFAMITYALGQKVIKDLRNRVYGHILQLHMRYFDRTPVGTNTTRVVNDLETLNAVFSEGLITIAADVLGLFTVLAVMLWTSVKLTMICLVSFPLLLIASYIFKEKVRLSFQRVRAAVAAMNGFLQEHISGMHTVQSFAAEKKVSEKFRDINRKYAQANLDGIFYYAVFFPVVEIIAAASLGFMVWWGAKGVLEGVVTIGQLVAFPMYLSRLFQPVRQIADKFNTLQMGLVAGSRVLEVLQTNTSETRHGHLKLDPWRGDIQFKNVNFSYDGENFVLSDLNFTLPHRKSLAIIGKTGSGKTSIINLLNRLYDWQEGYIYIGGIEIRQLDLAWLRSKISVVLQDVLLFHGSIFDNIRMRSSHISEQEVVQAAMELGIHDYIEALPGAYNYMVSERGENLSAGQRQLISFVRAMVRKPELLILDEATSSLDTETEMIVQKAIEPLIRNRSSIIIAHRLSTIQKADYVMVMDKGHVKEFGTHAELLAIENGYYTRLYNTYYQDAGA